MLRNIDVFSVSIYKKLIKMIDRLLPFERTVQREDEGALMALFVVYCLVTFVFLAILASFPTMMWIRVRKLLVNMNPPIEYAKNQVEVFNWSKEGF